MPFRYRLPKLEAVLYRQAESAKGEIFHPRPQSRARDDCRTTRPDANARRTSRRPFLKPKRQVREEQGEQIRSMRLAVSSACRCTKSGCRRVLRVPPVLDSTSEERSTAEMRE